MTTRPTTRSTSFNATAQAGHVAEAAARRSGTRVEEVEDMTALRVTARLFEDVWGRNSEGVPFGSEALRSLVHAGGAVTAAYDASTGSIVGAAVLVLGGDSSTYSLVAAAAPGATDRGIGFALKLRQRRWALERGRRVMRWTFDPLVSRNARFNLSKLGAGAGEYLESFYGRMDDALNGADAADRLVAEWRLDSPAAVAATERTVAEVSEPVRGEVRALGPDGLAAHVVSGPCAWIRAPRDIVALRRGHPAQASQWRDVVRAAFVESFAAGLAADAMTRTGWYRLTIANPEETP